MIPKLFSLLIIATLITSAMAAVPLTAASPSIKESGSYPAITYEGGLMKIVTEDFTVILQRNGTKPFFAWWANNDPSTVYVAQYKGILEYAELNSSGFSIKNMAEPDLWNRLIDEINAWDLTRLGYAERGMAGLFLAGSGIHIGLGRLQLDRVNLTDLSQLLADTVSTLKILSERASDQSLKQLLDGAVAHLNETIALIDGGATRGEIRDSLMAALKDVQKAQKIGVQKGKELIGSIIEERERLKDLATSFHPSYLSFPSCNWTISDVAQLPGGAGLAGVTFTLTLSEAPPKFDFAEGNIKIVVRIYNASVTETFSVGSASYSYDVQAGEMKMDLMIQDWDWNFEPSTVSSFGPMPITVSPALALRVDLSAFNLSNTPEMFLNDVEAISGAATMKGAIMGAGQSKINASAYDDDAITLPFSHMKAQKNIAGKIFKSIPAGKIRLSDESTLGGFFKFVPSAIVSNGSGEYLVDVFASYMSGGNHVRIFISYPYFNGTLLHDPSIGVGDAEATSNYIVTLGAAGAAASAISVQQIPAQPGWSSVQGYGAASVLVLGIAVIVIILVRRNPALL